MVLEQPSEVEVQNIYIPFLKCVYILQNIFCVLINWVKILFIVFASQSLFTLPDFEFLFNEKKKM